MQQNLYVIITYYQYQPDALPDRFNRSALSICPIDKSQACTLRSGWRRAGGRSSCPRENTRPAITTTTVPITLNQRNAICVNSEHATIAASPVSMAQNAADPRTRLKKNASVKTPSKTG